jgi:hypothetical protein
MDLGGMSDSVTMQTLGAPTPTSPVPDSMPLGLTGLSGVSAPGGSRPGPLNPRLLA